MSVEVGYTCRITIIYDYEHFEEYADPANPKMPIFEIMQRDNFNKYYVNINALDSKGSIVSIDNVFLENWLNSEQDNELLILGDFGSGKSSLCLKYTYELAKKYLEDKQNNFIPIFVPLADIDLESNFLKNVISYLLNAYDIKIKNLSQRSVFILDGFDEIATSHWEKDSITVLEKIMTLSAISEKILLTGRTHFFKQQLDIDEIFTKSGDTLLMKYVKKERNFSIYYIQDFDEHKILEYLKKRTSNWQHVFEKIKSIYDLEDLAKRPLLLDMIVETIDRFIEKKEVNLKDIYKEYTDIWIKYDYRKHGDMRLKLSPHDKSYVMEELALLMFLNDGQFIHNSFLKGHLEKMYNEKKFEKKLQLDQIDNDIRTCSFLNRDVRGNYKFIHKSFLEFFVAQKAVSEINKRNSDFLKQKLLSFEILNFIKDFEIENIQILKEFIDLTKEKTFEEAGYLGGNAVSILNGKKQSFQDYDFSKTVLVGADFSQTNLQGLNFYGANLRLANFNYCNLCDTDFRYADCDQISVEEGTEIRECKYSPDGKLIIFCLWNGNIEIITNDFKPYMKIRSHENSVSCFDISKDAKYLVSGGFDKKIKLFDFKSGKELAICFEHKSLVQDIVFSSKMYKIVSSSRDGIIMVSSIQNEQTLKKLWSIKLPTGFARSFCFHPFLNIIASASSDGLIQLIDSDVGKIYATLDGHQNECIYDILFCNSGNFIISCSKDPSIKLWDIKNRKELKTIYKNIYPNRSIAIDKSEKLLAVGDFENNVILLDFKTGKEIRRFDGHKGWILSINFEPLGKPELISSALDGSVIKWNLYTGQLIDKIEIADANFSCSGMKIKGSKFFVDVEYLVRRGAILNE